MEFKKRNECEIDFKREGSSFKVKISPSCTKEQIEALNISRFIEKEKPMEHKAI